MEPILSCSGLTKKYGELPALSELSVNMYSGRLICLAGGSGSGKTTFMRLAAGLIRPTAGELTVCGEPIGRETKELTAFLPDRDMFPPDMTVSEIVKLYYGFFNDFDVSRAFGMLGEIYADTGRRFGKYPAGMRSAIRTIIVISRRARLFLLDEPLCSLGNDGALREFIAEKIVECRSEESAVVVSERSLFSRADDLLLLRCGTPAYYGAAENYGGNLNDFEVSGNATDIKADIF